jgi:hypothetical protein
MSEKKEKLEELEVTTGQVDTPEPEPKKKKGRASKEDEEADVEEAQASEPNPDKLPKNEFDQRLAATFKRTNP